MSVELPPVNHRRSLLAAGYTDRDLRRYRRTGQLTSVRRGAYVPSPDDRLRDAVVRHRLLIAAVMPEQLGGSVVSHASAAVLYGLPLWAVALGRVHVTRPQPTGGRVGQTVHLHASPLRADETRVVDGLRVTSPVRTVIDVARTQSLDAAVAVADAALRAGLVDPAALLAGVERAAGWRGSPSARRVATLADGRSESVGESRSRLAMLRAGLPAPVPQWEVRRAGVLVARVDFGWPVRNTVGEFDGRVKYGRSLRPGEDPGKVVFREKVREDRLRDLGLKVARWTWDELEDFDEVADRIRRAYRRP